jgi:hypothetical protein
MKIISLACLAGASLLIAGTAFAADLGSEINNAQTHAGLAAAAANLDGVRMHMHHALNCLVGPGGEGFDAKQMNPCAQSGNGAIPDEMDAAKKAKLTSAKTELMQGIAATDLKMAKAAATSAQTTITSAK